MVLVTWTSMHTVLVMIAVVLLIVLIALMATKRPGPDTLPAAERPESPPAAGDMPEVEEPGARP